MAHIPSIVFIGGVWDCPLQHVQQSVHRRSLLPGWLGGHRWGLLVIAIGDRLSCWKIKNLYRNRYNTPLTSDKCYDHSQGNKLIVVQISQQARYFFTPAGKKMSQLWILS